MKSANATDVAIGVEGERAASRSSSAPLAAVAVSTERREEPSAADRWSATLHVTSDSRAFLTTAEDPAPRAVILMAGGDCLGLGTHPVVVDEAVRATRRYGWGCGAGALPDPWHAAHEELERRLAEFVGAETALLFPGRYVALVTGISALAGPDDLLLVDAPGNPALAEGAELAGARVEACAHADPQDLVRRLGRAADAGSHVLVAVEGVSGLDGRVSPLAEIVAATRAAGACLLVDDSYGLGVAGPRGRGSSEACGVRGAPDLLVGCLAGFLGGTGAFAAGPRAVMDALRRHVGRRPDTPPPLAASVSALAALTVLETDPELRARLWKNICFVREGLRARGFATGAVESALVPIPVGDEALLFRVKDWLVREGLYAAHLAPPLVEPSLARLRLTVKATQSAADLARALEILEQAGRRFGLAD